MKKENISNNHAYLTESDLLILDYLAKAENPLLIGDIVKKIDGTHKHISLRLDHLSKYDLIEKQKMESCKKGCKCNINNFKRNEVNTILNIFKKTKNKFS